MTDRELLEAAARAEGHAYPWVLPARGGERPWNPLTDDGDALRLAVKLRLWVGQHEDGVTVSDLYARFKVVIEEDHGTDDLAATRRAIVRAAAEIGRSMK
jgi:hypothetical protein